MEQVIYNLYISQSWQHDHTFDELVYLLGSNPDFRFVTTAIASNSSSGSVNKGRQRYELIKTSMEPCHVVLLLCGVYSSYNDWISKEIMACQRELNKPLIAIRYDLHSRVSPLVLQNATKIVQWDAKQIQEAIRILA